MSDNFGEAIYCYQTEIIKKSLNESVEVFYSKEEIKNLFNVLLIGNSIITFNIYFLNMKMKDLKLL